jgi:glycosyltransferase involved in cell wall biosynthesis
VIDVFVGDTFAGQALANLRRDDLLSAGIGDGAHGFAVDLRCTGISPLLNVEAFALSQKRMVLPSALSTAAPRKKVLHQPNSLDYLRATFANSPRPGDIRPAGLSVSSPARPAHERLTGTPTGPRLRYPSPPSPFYERLVAPTSTAGPPLCLGSRLGAYQDFVRHQWGQAELFEPSLISSEYAAFLGWYLSTYGRMRGSMRAPLSASDIEFLNKDVGSNGVSVAQKLFADIFAPAAESASALERAFVWSAYNSAVLSVEDCLVREADHQILMEIVEGSRDKPYPLTAFMLHFVRNNPLLESLPFSTVDERAFIYFIVLMFAMTAPHFLRYVPAHWRNALFEENGNNTSRFDRLSAALFAPESPSIDSRTWCELVAARGFDTRRNKFTTTTAKGSRIYAAALDLAATEAVDVQVIGPFTRALGIASSCRRLVDALQLTNYKLRVCDFSLDHPNISVGAAAISLSPPGPARINILHLNLEELPKVIAYGADVFSDASNVAVPYLELSSLSPAQMLGLSLVDEVWAASKFIADILSPFARTFVIRSSYGDIASIGRALARKRAYGDTISDDDFVFLTAGDALSAAHRKNPLGVARAFLRAFPDNPHVRLVIKTHSTASVHNDHERAVWRALGELSQEDIRISIIDAFVDEATHHALIEGADAYVSLHRAEGLGFHLLEAMALGTPVIATGYSGNIDFCTDETAFLVPYRITPVESALYPGVKAGQFWAEPDHSAAVEQMRRVYTNRRAREDVAASARRLATDKFSRETFAHTIGSRLHAIRSASCSDRTIAYRTSIGTD